MAAMPQAQDPPSVIKFNNENKKLITILSMDGGGVRGLIPAIIASFLEQQLQECRLFCTLNEHARLADYFDVIAGTSTGGIVGAMLTAPDENNRPLYAAKDIVPFYLEHSPKIFPQESGVFSFFKSMTGPKYDGIYLHNLLRRDLKEMKLHQTLTNLIIPAFDIKLLQPIIFSSFKIPAQPSINAKLSDICIGGSAAPTFLPSYQFGDPSVREFNLIDGGIVDNNPTLIAMIEVSKQMIKENPNAHRMHDGRLLVISIGSGSAKNEEKYNAKMTAKWGPLSWIMNGGSTPIIDCLFESGADMVDLHNNVLFQATQTQDNYIRIQDNSLTGVATSLDVSTKKNMQNLVKIGQELLNKPASRVDPETGFLEAIQDMGTNAEVLTRLAKRLSDKRKFRNTQKFVITKAQL
uniref:Patatin n=1 Tax=Chenopodium quinoa TaxID=63459 RepID=A0A803KWY4_CHEQI